MLAAALGRPMAAGRPVTCALGAARPRLARAAARPPLVRAWATASKEADQPKETAEKAQTVSVHFRLQRHVPFGQGLLVVGGAEALGNWEWSAAAAMTWSEGDVWTADIHLPVGATVEFKFVQSVPNHEPVWESCLNRTLAVGGAAFDLDAVWAAPLDTTYHAHLDGHPEAAAEAELTEEDVPPPFRPAEALAQFTEVVKQSLDAAANGVAAKQQPAKAAAATAEAASAELATKAQKQEEGEAEAKAQAKAAAVQAAADVMAADVLAVDGPSDALAASLFEEQQGAKATAAKAAAAKVQPAAAKKAAAAEGKAAAGAKVKLPEQAEAAVGEIIDAAGGAADAAGGAPPAPAPTTGGGGRSFQGITKVAGTVALGVAAAGMMSALAIDITDAAVLGAVTAGAAAALNTPSPSSARKGKGRKGGKRSAASASSTDAELSSSSEEEAEAAPVSIASKASAPGVILAAGVLSAIDAGKRILEANSDEE